MIAAFKVIQHVFGFGKEFENKDIDIFLHFMVMYFITRYRYYKYIVDLELGVLSVMVNDTYLWIIPYSYHCSL